MIIITQPRPPPSTAISQEERQAKIMTAELWYHSIELVSISKYHFRGTLKSDRPTSKILVGNLLL